MKRLSFTSNNPEHVKKIIKYVLVCVLCLSCFGLILAGCASATRTISFDGGNAVVGITPSKIYIKEGESIIIPASTMSKSGYTFEGWSDGTNVYHGGDSYTSTGDNVVFTAIWVETAVASAKINFVIGNGAYGTIPAYENAEVGDVIILSANSVKKDGYTLEGWNDGKYTYAEGSTYKISSEVTTFSAVWKIKYYPVTFSGGSGTDGTAPSTEDVAYNSEISLPHTTLIKTGYSFLGWNDGENTYAAGANYFVSDSAVQFTAVWTVNCYNITFIGGEGSEGTAPVQMTELYKAVVELPNENTLKKDGCTFGGWTDGVNTYDANSLYIVKAKSVKLYAIWNYNYYDVSFVGGEGAKGTAPKTLSIKYNANFFFPKNTFVKEGYAFDGWKAENGDKYDTSYANVCSDLIFTAQWKVKSYEISFDGGNSAEGKTPVMEDAAFGTTVTLPANPFTKKGYYFVGWSDGSTVYTENGDYTVEAKSVNFTAIWEKCEYLVSYLGADGATGILPATETSKYKTEITLPKNTMTKTNYVFIGWTTGNKTYGAGSEFEMPASDVTFTASFSTYNVKLILSDDETYYIVIGTTSATAEEIIIPSEHNNLPVKEIRTGAFKNLSLAINTVYIPSSIEVIGESAFENCNALTAVYTDDISAWCNINFTNYSSNPLYYANNLYFNGELAKEIVIDGSVNSVSNFAFCNCISLEKVTVNEGVNAIGASAFYNCSGIKELSLPASITDIAEHAFFGAASIKLVNISDISNWCAINFADPLANPLYYAHSIYLNGALINVLEIPDSLTSISKYAFYNCSLDGVNVTDLEAWCNVDFGDYSANPLYYAHNLYINDVLSEEITVPDDVTAIKDYAFSGCNSLVNITLPISVTKIGNSAFSYCRNLQKITLPGRVETIGNSAFSCCTALTSVVISDSVTSIGNTAFANCIALKDISIPDNTTYIGENAFYNCKALQRITVGEHNKAYNSDGDCLIERVTGELILGCNASVIPESVIKIKPYAFFNCTELTVVSIPDTVTNVCENSFANCYNITTLIIGNNVKFVVNNTYKNCDKIATVYYNGTAEAWAKINIGANNGSLASATVYFYSDVQAENCWRYVGGVPKAW